MSAARNTPVAPRPDGAGPARSAGESRSLAVEALMPRFLARRERDLGTIVEALERSDFKAIETLGHNMRGNGISYGFPEISAIGTALESAAKAKNHDGVRVQMTALAKWIGAGRDGDAGGSNRRTISGERPRVDPEGETKTGTTDGERR